MIRLCITPERRVKTKRIMDALHAGGRGKLCNGAPPTGAPFVVWGHRWLSEKIVPRAIRQGIEWWLVDNGFYLPANGGRDGHYAITLGGTAPQFIADADRSRLPVAMAGWRKGGDHVLLALPSQYHGRMMGLDMAAWSKTIAGRIRAVTGRPILVREKGCKRPLAQDLRQAFVLVTHSSKAAVEAAVAGVPVIVDACNPAAPVGGTDLAQIDTPLLPDGREAWWASLMAQQFTLDEMRAGMAWEMMARVRTMSARAKAA